MAMKDKRRQFADLDYESFKSLAKDKTLSRAEKIGFPEEYREGLDELIFEDLVSKLPALGKVGSRVLDIGVGCGGLGARIISNAKRLDQDLYLIDSEEMLSELVGAESAILLPGKFPSEFTEDKLSPVKGQCDVVIVYSVFQYILPDVSVTRFLDSLLPLLKKGGGRVLIGDIPNLSMLNRFLASDTGSEYHKAYSGTNERPSLISEDALAESINDSVVEEMVSYSRCAGYHAYTLPQNETLAMSNRREDVLIINP